MRLKPLLLSLAFAATAHAQQHAKDWTPAANAWWSHVQYLADDKLEGRKTGTPGYEAAVKYVEGQFQQIGLKPAGTEGYRQNFELVPTLVDTSRSSFAVDGHAFALGKDIRLLVAVGDQTVDAPMVFLGYGLHVPQKHVDDLAGVDVRGKIAVFINAAPAGLQGPQRAYARGGGVRWQALKAAGAVGMIQFVIMREGGPPPSTTITPTLVFADHSLDALSGVQVFGTLTAEGARLLFQLAGRNFSELEAAAKAGAPLPHFEIPGTVHARTILHQDAPIKAPNVVGLLEGSNRKLKKEYVVISAHLDHLGIGKPVNGDTIYNGAMDNASGVASVIESAKLLAAGPRPRRSILFIALAGEELGELGSQYFATRPSVPRSQIVADLNMDMYLPLFPLRFLEIQGLGESTLGNDARAICQLNDVEPQFDKQPDENRFVRSDQVNFVKQGIPALAFKFGWVPDSPEMKTFNEWVKIRYHRPSDDLQQPVDKVAAAQFTSLLAQLAVRVADAPTRPSWYPESSFASPTK